MNKIGTLDIIKAYLGNKELSANNAYMGEISLIKGSGPTPVEIDYFYLQPLYAGNYSVDANGFSYRIDGDKLEFSKDKTSWRKFSSLESETNTVTTSIDDYLSNNPNTCLLALDINAYENYVVGSGDWIGLYEQYSSTGDRLNPKEATLLSTDSNYAYYACELTNGVQGGRTRQQWFIMYNDSGKRYEGRSLTINEGNPLMVDWDGSINSGTAVTDTSIYGSIQQTTTVVTETIPLNANEKLYIRGKGVSNQDGITGTTVYLEISLVSGIENVQYNVGGYLQTLYDYDVEDFSSVSLLRDYYGAGMFMNKTNLVSASDLKLPITDLSGFKSCYLSMFQSCSSLTTAPELPATTLANFCYYSMFYGCSSLTSAPALPATTLANFCYSEMFCACSRLTSAPSLPATTLTESCYYGMFQSCSSLTTAPELPATTLTESCYRQMFQVCTSLTSAPALPATTLAEWCYRQMFQGCTSLTTAPELPATTLTESCYYGMFQGCSSLNYIKCLAINGINTNHSTTNWVSNVSSTGTFVRDANATWPTGNYGIPTGWTLEPPVSALRYVKVTDFTTVENGDEFIFVNESTGQVVTDAFNLSVNYTTVATNQSSQLSDETITITNGEFVETELDKIQHATYHQSSTKSYKYDAKPLILKKVYYDSSSFLLVYNNNGTDYILTITSTSSNRKLKLVSPIPASPSNLQLWKIYTENNKLFILVIKQTTSNDYGSLLASGNTYGSLWLGNYRTSYTETWTYTIYKKV